MARAVESKEGLLCRLGLRLLFGGKESVNVTVDVCVHACVCLIGCMICEGTVNTS